MRVMIDTNIFISAALFPKGRAAEALFKALSAPYQPVVCDYVIDELHRKFQEKFPNRTVELEAFLYTVLPVFDVVSTPEKVADVIDFQEYKTHIKNESAIYAVYTFCRKLGQTAAIRRTVRSFGRR